MKNSFYLLVTAVFISITTFISCNNDKDNSIVRYYTAWGTVDRNQDGDVIIRRDNRVFFQCWFSFPNR